MSNGPTVPCRFRLPEAARKPLEEELASYQMSEKLAEFVFAAPDPRPSDVKQKLERGAELAGELLEFWRA